MQASAEPGSGRLDRMHPPTLGHGEGSGMLAEPKGASYASRGSIVGAPVRGTQEKGGSSWPKAMAEEA